MSPASMQGYGEVQAAIVSLLETARRTVAQSINAAMTASYCEIGRRIVERARGTHDEDVSWSSMQVASPGGCSYQRRDGE